MGYRSVHIYRAEVNNCFTDNRLKCFEITIFTRVRPLFILNYASLKLSQLIIKIDVLNLGDLI